MTPEMIAILGIGATNLAAIISMTGILVTLMLRQDRRIDRLEERIDRLEERIDQRFEGVNQRFEGVNQRFDQMEERMQRLEQGQARLEGELAIIREVLFARSSAGD